MHLKFSKVFSFLIWGQFHHILCAAFIRPNPKGAKNTDKPSVFFALLGSAHVKAVCKMLVKSTPVVTAEETA